MEVFLQTLLLSNEAFNHLFSFSVRKLTENDVLDTVPLVS